MLELVDRERELLGKRERGSKLDLGFTKPHSQGDWWYRNRNWNLPEVAEELFIFVEISEATIHQCSKHPNEQWWWWS